MKRIIVAAVLLSASFDVFGATHARIEPNAIVDRSLRPSTIQSLVVIVRGNGYRCDSVSAALPLTFSRGFTLSCNYNQYDYEIRDVGGQIRVKVN